MRPPIDSLLVYKKEHEIADPCVRSYWYYVRPTGRATIPYRYVHVSFRAVPTNAVRASPHGKYNSLAFFCLSFSIVTVVAAVVAVVAVAENF